MKRKGNGAGTVFVDRGQVRARYWLDGKRKTVTFGPVSDGWTKTKGEKELRAILTDITRGVYKEPSRLTFGDFATAWLEQHIQRERLKRTTAGSYRTILQRHLMPRFERMKVAEITTAMVKSYTSKAIERRLSARTVNSHVQCLGLILGGAVEEEIITRNPVTKKCRVKQRKPKLGVLMPEQAQKVEAGYDALIAAEEDRDRRDDLIVSRMIYLLAWGLGLRKGEIFGLRWHRLELAADKPTITIEETWTAYASDTPKSDESFRTLELPAKLVQELRRHRLWSAYSLEGEYVVPNPRSGNPLDPHVYYDLFREACAKAKVEPPKRALHDLRRSYATAAAATANPWSVKQRMGHASLQTTQGYVDLASELFSDDVAALEERQFGATAQA